MPTEVLFTVEDAPEGGFVAHALGPLFVQADNAASLREQVRDAVNCQFDPEQKPRIIRLHDVRDEVLAA